MRKRSVRRGTTTHPLLGRARRGLQAEGGEEGRGGDGAAHTEAMRIWKGGRFKICDAGANEKRRRRVEEREEGRRDRVGCRRHHDGVERGRSASCSRGYPASVESVLHKDGLRGCRLPTVRQTTPYDKIQEGM